MIDLEALVWNPPPENFDPLQESGDALAKYCLPPRPDPNSGRVSYANWFRAMSPPLTFIRAAPEQVFTLADGSQSAAEAQAGVQGGASALREFSRNWSGGVIRPLAGRFRTVEGSWTMTLPGPPHGIGDDPPPDGDYRASIWVGLDGHDPGSPSMPQIGTLKRLVIRDGRAESTELSAWWQWWLRDVPHQSRIVINGLSLEPGHEIYAKVIALGPFSARFFLKNMTKGTAIGFDWVARDRLHSLIEGLTAEWVVERPTVVDNEELYPLPDYGNVRMSGCCATVETGGRRYEQDLAGASLIRMVGWDVSVPPGLIISTADRLGRDGLHMRYGDFGP